MSLCTLPNPAIPALLSISPTINVALFISEKQISLCRRSGQQVWSTRLPQVSGEPLTVSSVSWSQDGQYLALIFTTGSYEIYDVEMGRPVTRRHNIESAVTSLVWSQVPPDFGSGHSIPKIVNEITDASSENSALSSLAAVGTREGALRIQVYGALDIDEIPIDPACHSEIYLLAADENLSEYVAVQGTSVHILRSKSQQDDDGADDLFAPKDAKEFLNLLDLSSSSEKSTTQCCALAVRLVEQMVHHAQKLRETMQSLHTVNSAFIDPFASQLGINGGSNANEMLQTELVGSVIHGKYGPATKHWIETHHEQGFKKWYKAASQLWDSILQLVKGLQDTVTRSLAIWGRLDHDITLVMSLHSHLYTMMRQLIPMQEKFEQQAGYVEYVFREEIDRPIAVTKISHHVLSEIGETLLGDGFLGESDFLHDEETLNLANLIEKSLTTAVEKVKNKLRSELALAASVDLGHKVAHVRCLPHQKGKEARYAIITHNNERVILDKAGKVLERRSIKGKHPVFLGKGIDTISLDTDNKSLILPNGDELPLQFEPAAVVCRVDEREAIACVLSHDCQHYQFLDLYDTK